MENLYLKYGKKKDCNGCGGCIYVCPVHAISMVEDEEGFLYPKINEEKCINCKKCEKYCSNFNNNHSKKIAYRGINQNKDDLKISSSGGIFLILARKVIENNGVVFGVKYDEKLNVIHGYAESIEDVKKFCGSKYVRSNLGNSYENVKKFLDQGREVLFTGTSCQIQGLNIFLKKKYTNLITMDIICHGNPSPKIFKKYIEELETINNKKIKNIYFRKKSNGWRNQNTVIEYIDGTEEIEKTYIKAFLKELINRPCCYDCKFASLNRVSDITIGDCWGIENIEPDINEELGVSLFIINTDKGTEILEKVKDRINIRRLECDKIIKYNHFCNVLPNFKRKRFFKEVNKTNSIIKTMKKYNDETILDKIINKIRIIIWRKNNAKNKE